MTKHTREQRHLASSEKHTPSIRADAKVDQPSPSQVDRIVNDAPDIAAAQELNLGDLEIGKSVTHDVWVYNLTTLPAGLTVTLSGDPSITLVQAPPVLQSSTEAQDSNKRIVVKQESTTSGRFKTFMHVTATFRDRPPQTTTIVLAGAAHQPGGPTIEESENALLTSMEHLRDDAVERNQNAQRTKAIVAEYENPKGIEHAGHETNAQNLTHKIGNAIAEIYRNRGTAVTAVKDAVGDFRRIPKPKERELEVELAHFALMAASELLPAFVEAAAEPILEEILERTHAPEALQKVFVSAISEALKEGTRDVVGAGEGKGGKPDEGAVTGAMKTDFFSQQLMSLSAAERKAEDFAVDAGDAIRPLLRVDASAAIGTLDGVLGALGSKTKAAFLVQQDATLREWVQFVGKVSMGEASDGSTLMGEVNGPPGPNFEGKDGLIDVNFDADYDKPTQEVQVRRVKLQGVRNSVATLLAEKPLGEWMLPTRASGFLSRGVGPSVTVVRDDAGHVDYTDDTGREAGMAGHWLTRKAGESGPPSESAERRGAKILMNEVLKTKPDKIETDSDENKSSE